MQTVTLNNGITMPLLGFGVYQAEPKECEEAVLAALETGYRSIVTAAAYMNEEAVGRAVKKSGIPREELFITTKLWIQDAGYESTKKAFETSMEKLGLDFLDLYLIHQPMIDYYGAWRAMEELYRAGRVRAIGVSNFLPHHLENLLEVCTVPPMVDQIEFHPGYVQWETVEFCRASQILVEAWSPLGRQRLADDPLLAELAGKYGVSQAQICLRFALDCGVVPLPKSADAGRMRQNLALDFALEAEDLERLRTMPQTGWSGLHPDK